MNNKVFFLETVLEASSILPVLSSNDNVFEIDSTASINEAINYIKNNNYKLVYINIEFLDMNILPFFICLMNENFIGRIVFSANYKSPLVIKKIASFKSLDVLIKPFDNIWLKNAIIEHLQTGKYLGNHSKNILSQYFILKLIDSEKGDIALKINFDGRKGLIVFDKGIITYAKYYDRDGVKAVKSIISDFSKSAKTEIKITKPGLFIKKNIKIAPASILDEYNSSGEIIIV